MMYPSEWLRLREAADARARDVGLLDRLGAALANRARRLGRPPLIVDLGAGTGALMRALHGRTPAGARWRLVDKEASLLEEALVEAGDATVETIATDLNGDLSSLIGDADLVAATAFYDLASGAWLSRFVAALPRDALVYAALTYDGEERWSPPAADLDHEVLTAFHMHQRQDFGLGGPALGPSAALELREALRGAGFRVSTARTPWRLDRSRDAALMDELMRNTAAAATLFGADGAGWSARPRETALIGHVDLWATPV